METGMSFILMTESPDFASDNRLTGSRKNSELLTCMNDKCKCKICHLKKPFSRDLTESSVYSRFYVMA